MTGQEQLEMLKKHCEDLGEYFDSVQIFATTHDEEGSASLNSGVGNWFARFGQVSEWLTKSNERTKEYVRHEENED